MVIYGWFNSTLYKYTLYLPIFVFAWILVVLSPEKEKKAVMWWPPPPDGPQEGRAAQSRALLPLQQGHGGHFLSTYPAALVSLWALCTAEGWFCPGDNPTVSPMNLSSSAPLFLSIPSGRSTWKRKAKTCAQAQDHSLTQLSPAIPTPSLHDPSSVILSNLTRGCLKNVQDPKT